MTLSAARPRGHIATEAVQPLLHAVRAAGRTPVELLRGTGIDAAALDEPRWLPAPLTDALWQTAAARLRRDISLDTAAAVEPSSYGLLTFLLASCDTVGAALDRLPRYYRLLSNATVYRVEHGRGGVSVAADLRWARPAAVESFAVAVALCFLRREARAPLGLREVRLVQRRPDAELVAAHERLFGAPIRFGCALGGFVLDRRALDVPLRGAEPRLRALLEAHADRTLAEPAAEPLAGRLRHHIAARGAHCALRAADVAADMAMSERTLRRLLRAEGTSFRAELDAVLWAVARDRLESERVEDVALALGFSEAAAFRRAHRRWRGSAPNPPRC
jgi:AraC-like DNA-binding protein